MVSRARSIVSFDVKSLFTNETIDLAIKTIKHNPEFVDDQSNLKQN